MTPMVRELAKAFRATSLAGRDALVEDSVGSSGGVRAAADGAIDIALVARPLTARERALGLVLLPVARSAVVVGAHQNVHRAGLTSQEYTELVAGRRTELDGQTLTVLLRDRGESLNTTWERGLPALTVAREAAYEANRARVLYYDEAMIEALGTTPSSIGLTDFSLVAAVRTLGSIKALSLDGVEPSVAAILAGSWPYCRDLSFVYLPSRRDRVGPFVDFVRSEQGRALIRAMHAAPLPLLPEGDLPPGPVAPVGPEGLE
jgi:phosphate transport system substrate-binding protein